MQLLLLRARPSGFFERAISDEPIDVRVGMFVAQSCGLVLKLFYLQFFYWYHLILAFVGVW